MEDNFDKLQRKLKEVGQEHVLTFWNELELEEKKRLKEQIQKIDFIKLRELYEKSKKQEPFSMEAISPIPYVNTLTMPEKEKEVYRRVGEEIIEKEKVAVISMAGGQRHKAWIPWPKSNV